MSVSLRVRTVATIRLIKPIGLVPAPANREGM